MVLQKISGAHTRDERASGLPGCRLRRQLEIDDVATSFNLGRALTIDAVVSFGKVVYVRDVIAGSGLGIWRKLHVCMRQ